MSVPIIPVTAADVATLVAADKECWQLDRVFYGLPTCDIVQRSSVGDAFSGVDSETFAVVQADVPCAVAPYSDEQVASSAGVITAQDQRFIAYDIGLLDTKSIYVKYLSQYWKIMAQDYRAYSSRSELQIRPMQGGV